MKGTLNLNNSKGLTMLRESLNKVIDKKITQQLLAEKMASLKGKSFGVLNDLFESVLDELYDTTAGKKVIGSYVKLLRENEAIKAVYKVYESINSPKTNDSTVAAYVIADICESVNKAKLKEGEAKMYEIVCEALKHCDAITSAEVESIITENKDINKRIDYLTHKSNKSNVSCLNERANSIKEISDYIKDNEIITENVVNENVNSKDLLSELQSLLESTGTEWGKQTLMDLSFCYMSDGKKEDLFESYKEKCLGTIDELLEDSDADKASRLTTMKNQLNEKKYNEETVLDDLFKLAELNNTLIED